MKILLVQDHLRSGGTERHTTWLARGFAARGHPVQVLTFRPGGALAADLVGVAGVTHHSLQPWDSGLDWWAPRLRRRARAFAPDVVICMGRMGNCYAAQLTKALPRARVLTTLRTGKPLPRRYVEGIRASACCVSNSEAARDDTSLRHGIAASHFRVVANGLVFPPGLALPGERAHSRALAGAGDETVVMLCVAMFRPEKNHRGLLEAIAGLPRNAENGGPPAWQLWLVGEGSERPACAALAQELGLAEHIAFLGWQADPRPCYRAADIAVLASRRESLSNFLIEAQAHGLPAVAFAARGVTETGALTVPMDDGTSLRRQLLHWIDEPAARAEAGELARRDALARFAPEVQLDAWLNLCTELAAHD